MFSVIRVRQLLHVRGNVCCLGLVVAEEDEGVVFVIMCEEIAARSWGIVTLVLLSLNKTKMLSS